MADIKIKNNESKTIKSLDKTIAWTERVKDPIVYANEKTKDIASGNTNVADYGEEKIKYVSNRIKDETLYSGKKIGNYTKNKLTNKIMSHKKIIHNSDKVKTSKRIIEQGKKLAIDGTKKTVNGTKKVANATISMVKGIIAGVKSLVGLLVAGGSLVAMIVLVICLVGLLVTSIYGIFFSSHDTGTIKMSDCIVKLNEEMNNKIEQIEKTNIHNEVVINSNKALWKDVLSIYAVRVSNGDNKKDVITIDNDKKEILKEVFWDMNSINYEIKTEKYESESIGSLVNNDLTFSDNNGFSGLSTPNPTEDGEIQVLHINISSKTPEKMINEYNFNESQRKQYEELSSEKNLLLWSSVIYGVFGSSGKITEWKQQGKEWSDIKIGTTNKSIGEVGCLVTSIAILIEKSGVSTKNIYPFNPGTFVIALNNNYGFDFYGNLQYSAISKVVPNFIYQNTVILNGKTKNEKLSEIRNYYEKGYYISVEVKGATPNNQHWVAVDSVNNNTIIMLDPASNETNMWSKYNWEKTSQFVYFKVLS